MISFSPLVSFAPSRWSVAVVIVILAGAGYLKWNAGLMPEHVSIPNPTPPSPNARDIYNRAESMLRDADSINPLPRRTSKTYAKLTSAAQIAKDRRLVAENQPALAVLREGLQDECLEPPVRSIDTLTPYYAKDQAMARLLTLEGQLHARDGDWSGAISDDIDTIQLGISLQHGATLTGWTAGLECEAYGRNPAWKYADHLSAAQAEAAAKRMATVCSTAVRFSSELQEEQRCGQATMLNIYSKHLSINGNYSELTDNPYTFSQNVAFHLESPRVAYDLYTKNTDEVIRRANLPWPEQITLKPLPLPTGLMDSLFFEIFRVPGTPQLDNAALNALLQTELALRAYRLEHHGAYPSVLEQLAPAYLPTVPTDPFSANQPLRYRLAGGKPLLYSIGPDAIDNGGQAYVLPSSINVLARQDNTTGDIVAGRY